MSAPIDLREPASLGVALTPFPVHSDMALTAAG